MHFTSIRSVQSVQRNARRSYVMGKKIILQLVIYSIIISNSDVRIKKNKNVNTCELGTLVFLYV